MTSFGRAKRWRTTANGSAPSRDRASANLANLRVREADGKGGAAKRLRVSETQRATELARDHPYHLHSQTAGGFRSEVVRQAASVIRYRKLIIVAVGSREGDDDCICASFGGIGHKLVHRQPDWRNDFDRKLRVAALDNDLALFAHHARKVAAQSPEVTKATERLVIAGLIDMLVDSGDRGDAAGGQLELLRTGLVHLPALQAQQCRNLLKAVHHTMIDFPGQQLGAAERGVLLLYYLFEIADGITRRQAKLHLVDDDLGERFELRNLMVGDRARLVIDDA